MKTMKIRADEVRVGMEIFSLGWREVMSVEPRPDVPNAIWITYDMNGVPTRHMWIADVPVPVRAEEFDF